MVLKFGLQFASNLRASPPRPRDQWHLDQIVVSIGGNRQWLWRAVDSEGEVLDLLVQSGETRGCLRLMRKLLRKQGFAPTVVGDRQAAVLWRCEARPGSLGPA